MKPTDPSVSKATLDVSNATDSKRWFGQFGVLTLKREKLKIEAAKMRTTIEVTYRASERCIIYMASQYY